jgi:arylsulfatase A-like enzyme
MRRFFLAPLDDFALAVQRAIPTPPWSGAIAALLAAAVTWWVYVPAHELLHAFGCLAAGGTVERLEIRPEYGAAFLTRWFSFVTVGSEYAGRLSGFDTGGSDLAYVVTVWAPYALTVVAGVPLLRAVGRRARGGAGSSALLGAAIVLGFAPFANLIGDFYELGSIPTSRVAAGLTGADPQRWRSDDLPLLVRQLADSGLGAGDVGVLAVGLALGTLAAFGTYALGIGFDRALRRVRGGAAAAAALGVVLAAGCAPQPPPPRHVVFISLDTTRADQLGLYGNSRVRTPRLDALAAESVVLDDFMTVVPTTLASHASLFTGTYPHRHGVPRNGFVVDDANLMLAEILGEHRFTSAGFAASFAISERFRIAQGFDHWDEAFERAAGAEGRFQDERPAAAVTDAVVEWLEASGVPERLFLFVHYFDPHAPYAAPAPYDTLYDPRGREDLPDWFSVSSSCNAAGGERSAAAERLALQYAGEVSYMDEHVGRLLDALRERGVLDEALLVVTSDHGENFWEHPSCFDHGFTPYQTTTRAVGIVRLPGGRLGGTRLPRLAATVDVLPTVLGLLGVPEPERIDGTVIELEPTDSDSDSDPIRFAQATKPWEGVEIDPRWKNALKARCARRGPDKLIQVPYQEREELYDLERDPLEQHDLLREPTPEIESRVRALRAELEAWAASADPLPSSFEDERREDTLRRLKALGYLGGE